MPKIYDGKTAVLIATGPSLTVQQVNVARHAHETGDIVVMGCNDAYVACEFLDVLYAADWRWIEYHRETLRSRRMWKWTHHNPAHDGEFDEWQRVKTHQRDGLSTDPWTLHRGGHSGFQLINLAYLMGCRKLILIGYDCHKGGHHFFGQHPTSQMRVDTNYPRFVNYYDDVARQISDRDVDLTIINATPGSALKVFPTGVLGDLLYGAYSD